jgi:hypothetical protein
VTHIALWLGITASLFAIIGGVATVIGWADRKFTASIRDVLGVADDEPSVGEQLRGLKTGQATQQAQVRDLKRVVTNGLTSKIDAIHDRVTNLEDPKRENRPPTA